ncbi:alpha-ketoglutarate-dependent dioxygenase AlkB family protein [Celerinatantimonas diazotrophica]|uniref:DNA-N1-methyladenine dioxygenase n=1 Tax=Celerinatantimonas diazotrophica TaxID=412034 RepID=A0A4R1K433_9GAMM|nr:alpha-ketoglutarate-dependent dioxygenase AlkB [Celerinatantimonas diazotrophica]TCK58670.1 DNA-N1-methyladenine dioxygenase [Celerinatantimonas diazotrophica]CAG9297299.1 hypothetical protein CEDIAZO_02475 [Celerinatantimonas diazotrophica]
MYQTKNNTPEPERIELNHESYLLIYPNWSQLNYQLLRNSIAWQQHSIRLFGKQVNEPRLSAWMGDPQCAYRYSQQLRLPIPWCEPLKELRQQLNRELGTYFNSVLANLYRDGGDAMGWHSDDEPELLKNAMIASLSFGCERRFLIREKKSRTKVGEWALGNGTLLIMAAKTQQYYEHSIARTKKTVGERINLTFRQIHISAQ